MIVAERNSLIPVKKLISNSLVQLELFENHKGELFLSSTSEQPEGLVYYATTPLLLCSFFENAITLQKLFDNSPSLIVEISSTGKTVLYSRNDIEIKLAYGHQPIKELNHTSTIEIWC